jgi:hypothetical protein
MVADDFWVTISLALPDGKHYKSSILLCPTGRREVSWILYAIAAAAHF